MKMVPVTVFVLSVAAGIAWGIEWHHTAQLRRKLAGLRDHSGEIGRLRQERGRLLRLRPSGEEWVRLRRETGSQEEGPSSAADDNGDPDGRPLRPGIWAAAADWRNRGRATPESAVETVLWAASGGDLDALKPTLAVDDDTRSALEAVYARLPGSVLEQYGTPDDLLAVVVAGNTPLDSAQIIARQSRGADDVTEYLRLKNSEGLTRQVYLSLHRSPDGWRLVVPSNALAGIEAGPPPANAP